MTTRKETNAEWRMRVGSAQVIEVLEGRIRELEARLKKQVRETETYATREKLCNEYITELEAERPDPEIIEKAKAQHDGPTPFDERLVPNQWLLDVRVGYEELRARTEHLNAERIRELEAERDYYKTRYEKSADYARELEARIDRAPVPVHMQERFYKWYYADGPGKEEL